MSLRTSNKYGKISITDDAVAMVCSQVASECYGVVELVSRRLSDNLNRVWGKAQYGKGIKIATVDNLMFIEARCKYRGSQRIYKRVHYLHGADVYGNARQTLQRQRSRHKSLRLIKGKIYASSKWFRF